MSFKDFKNARLASSNDNTLSMDSNEAATTSSKAINKPSTVTVAGPLPPKSKMSNTPSYDQFDVINLENSKHINNDKQLSSSASITSSVGSQSSSSSSKKIYKVFSFIGDTYRDIRRYSSILRTDKYNTNLLDTINRYKVGCNNAFENAPEDKETSLKLVQNIIRTLDLFKEMCTTHTNMEEYQHRICELLAIIIAFELWFAGDSSKEEQQLIESRIIYIMRKHLIQDDKEETQYNILRTLVYIPKHFNAREIMCAIFEEFIPFKPVLQINVFSDKLYMLYIIIFYRWMQLQIDSDDKLIILNYAEQFMKPSATLCANKLYAKHLPRYTKHSTATRTILTQMKFYLDIRNASIIDNAFKKMGAIVNLCDDDEDDDVIMEDNSESIDFLELYSSVQLEPLGGRLNNIKLEEKTIIDTVDLTDEEGSKNFENNIQERNEKWLNQFNQLAKQFRESQILLERIQNQQTADTEKVICLDSDSDDDEEEQKSKQNDKNAGDNNNKKDTTSGGEDLFVDSYPLTTTPINCESDLESSDTEDADLTKLSSRFLPGTLRTYQAAKKDKVTPKEKETRSQMSEFSDTVINRFTNIDMSYRRDSIHITSTPPEKHGNDEDEGTDVQDEHEDDVESEEPYNFLPITPKRPQKDLVLNQIKPMGPYPTYNNLNAEKVVFSQARSRLPHNQQDLRQQHELNDYSDSSESKTPKKSEQHKKRVHFNTSPLGPTSAYSTGHKQIIKPSLLKPYKASDAPDHFHLGGYNCYTFAPSIAESTSTTASTSSSLKQQQEQEHNAKNINNNNDNKDKTSLESNVNSINKKSKFYSKPLSVFNQKYLHINKNQHKNNVRIKLRKIQNNDISSIIKSKKPHTTNAIDKIDIINKQTDPNLVHNKNDDDAIFKKPLPVKPLSKSFKISKVFSLKEQNIIFNNEKVLKIKNIPNVAMDTESGIQINANMVEKVGEETKGKKIVQPTKEDLKETEYSQDSQTVPNDQIPKISNNDKAATQDCSNSLEKDHETTAATNSAIQNENEENLEMEVETNEEVTNTSAKQNEENFGNSKLNITSEKQLNIEEEEQITKDTIRKEQNSSSFSENVDKMEEISNNPTDISTNLCKEKENKITSKIDLVLEKEEMVKEVSIKESDKENNVQETNTSNTGETNNMIADKNNANDVGQTDLSNLGEINNTLAPIMDTNITETIDKTAKTNENSTADHIMVNIPTEKPIENKPKLISNFSAEFLAGLPNETIASQPVSSELATKAGTAMCPINLNTNSEHISENKDLAELRTDDVDFEFDSSSNTTTAICPINIDTISENISDIQTAKDCYEADKLLEEFNHKTEDIVGSSLNKIIVAVVASTDINKTEDIVGSSLNKIIVAEEASTDINKYNLKTECRSTRSTAAKETILKTEENFPNFKKFEKKERKVKKRKAYESQSYNSTIATVGHTKLRKVQDNTEEIIQKNNMENEAQKPIIMLEKLSTISPNKKDKSRKVQDKPEDIIKENNLGSHETCDNLEETSPKKEQNSVTSSADKIASKSHNDHKRSPKKVKETFDNSEETCETYSVAKNEQSGVTPTDKITSKTHKKSPKKVKDDFKQTIKINIKEINEPKVLTLADKISTRSHNDKPKSQDIIKSQKVVDNSEELTKTNSMEEIEQQKETSLSDEISLKTPYKVVENDNPKETIKTNIMEENEEKIITLSDKIPSKISKDGVKSIDQETAKPEKNQQLKTPPSPTSSIINESQHMTVELGNWQQDDIQSDTKSTDSDGGVSAIFSFPKIPTISISIHTTPNNKTYFKISNRENNKNKIKETKSIQNKTEIEKETVKETEKETIPVSVENDIKISTESTNKEENETITTKIKETITEDSSENDKKDKVKVEEGNEEKLIEDEHDKEVEEEEEVEDELVEEDIDAMEIEKFSHDSNSACSLPLKKRPTQSEHNDDNTEDSQQQLMLTNLEQTQEIAAEVVIENSDKDKAELELENITEEILPLQKEKRPHEDDHHNELVHSEEIMLQNEEIVSTSNCNDIDDNKPYCSSVCFKNKTVDSSAAQSTFKRRRTHSLNQDSHDHVHTDEIMLQNEEIVLTSTCNDEDDNKPSCSSGRFKSKSIDSSSSSFKRRSVHLPIRPIGQPPIQIVVPHIKDKSPTSSQDQQRPAESTQSVVTRSQANSQTSSSLPESYPATPMLSVANVEKLMDLNRFIEDLLASPDVMTIIDNANACGYYAEGQAYEMERIAILEHYNIANAKGSTTVTKPLYWKKSAGDTISIYNDNDNEWISLPPSTAKQLLKLSFVLSILQQQYKVSDVRQRINIALTFLIQTSYTSKLKPPSTTSNSLQQRMQQYSRNITEANYQNIIPLPSANYFRIATNNESLNTNFTINTNMESIQDLHVQNSYSNTQHNISPTRQQQQQQQQQHELNLQQEAVATISANNNNSNWNNTMPFEQTQTEIYHHTNTGQNNLETEHHHLGGLFVGDNSSHHPTTPQDKRNTSTLDEFNDQLYINSPCATSPQNEVIVNTNGVQLHEMPQNFQDQQNIFISITDETAATTSAGAAESIHKYNTRHRPLEDKCSGTISSPPYAKRTCLGNNSSILQNHYSPLSGASSSSSPSSATGNIARNIITTFGNQEINLQNPYRMQQHQSQNPPQLINQNPHNQRITNTQHMQQQQQNILPINIYNNTTRNISPLMQSSHHHMTTRYGGSSSAQTQSSVSSHPPRSKPIESTYKDILQPYITYLIKDHEKTSKHLLQVFEEVSNSNVQKSQKTKDTTVPSTNNFTSTANANSIIFSPQQHNMLLPPLIRNPQQNHMPNYRDMPILPSLIRSPHNHNHHQNNMSSASTNQLPVRDSGALQVVQSFIDQTQQSYENTQQLQHEERTLTAEKKEEALQQQHNNSIDIDHGYVKEYVSFVGTREQALRDYEVKIKIINQQQEQLHQQQQEETKPPARLNSTKRKCLERNDALAKTLNLKMVELALLKHNIQVKLLQKEQEEKKLKGRSPQPPTDIFNNTMAASTSSSTITTTITKARRGRPKKCNNQKSLDVGVLQPTHSCEWSPPATKIKRGNNKSSTRVTRHTSLNINIPQPNVTSSAIDHAYYRRSAAREAVKRINSSVNNSLQ